MDPTSACLPARPACMCQLWDPTSGDVRFGNAGLSSCEMVDSTAQIPTSPSPYTNPPRSVIIHPVKFLQ